ncbi:MAG: hypothetical protein JW955_04145 [Sedimentisphaerales bacterium]|nr:hypothetical protein [Sedimentisphaerales bacterium]
MAKQSTVIVLEVRLVKSPVWLLLSGRAKTAYLLFRTKCQMGKPPGKPRCTKTAKKATTRGSTS